VSGWIFSRDRDDGLGARGDHLGIGGRSGNTGRLVFFHGDRPQDAVAGKTEIPRWQWRHVVLVRDAEKVRVYLDGNLEIETSAAVDFPAGLEQYFLGGRSDNDSNWEGRLDEIAIFNRALSAGEVAKLQVK
jgi:Concanavalin A-like lectin/glucanases superfamily